MTKRMLIDASHPEETRVVVINDHQLEDFDFESSNKKQLKGNIYLAKVTRVEPSLQAAFVDYGGQRHGFLAFSEIHPDYYQIPQADRKLLREPTPSESEAAEDEGAAPAAPAANGAAEDAASNEAPLAVATDPDEEAADDFDEQARQRSRLLRGYKIQEVIKRRQILLVQVVKEERGNKGAALTTYLSLAGRYSVLMPNTGRGGGISRKIANPADRSRLKSIARELEVPEGMGLIIRTAGQARSKLEIKRDYEYSLRLWNDIRELTLKSVAPCTIHEEGALVKRAIRDLYSRDIDEVLVEGEDGYRTARKVMSMLMPSRARRVKLYKDELPLFHRYGVEEQLDGLHQPDLLLRSGASIVIHTTEALTAIDVNSGRSTRERNIEETALKTNLEAAEEIARQLRLRDIAGLVVIDFIDMGEMRNQRSVERRLRDHLKSDRARVQLGRISAFGLLELSRQRLRPSFQELSTQLCPTCKGSGAVRSVGSAALQALRAIELEGIKGKAGALAVTLPLPAALYLLNQKRDRVITLEQRYGMSIEIGVDEEMIAGTYRLEISAARPESEAEEVVAPAAAPPREAAAAPEPGEEDGDGGRKRRRRRRRRRRGETEAVTASEAMPEPVAEHAAANGEAAAAPPREAAHPEEEEPEAPLAAAAEPPEAAKPRRPRRRSSRRAAREVDEAVAGAPPAAASRNGAAEEAGLPVPEEPVPAAEVPVPAPREGALSHEHAPALEDDRVLPAAAAVEPERAPVMAAAGEDAERAAGEADDEGSDAELTEAERPAPRRGWWNRFVRKDE
jgi:ribonuclease E